MKVFIDTNVLLDVLTRRKPFYAASVQIWSLVEKGDVEGFVSVISFNNVYYIVRKLAGKVNADQALRILRDIFMPISVDPILLNQAIDADMSDFEDAIQFHSAVRAGAEFLLTRNPSHFRGLESSVAIAAPDEFLAVWRQRRSV